jgi:catechol 2,3-dioxygenase-like lactoylglutathione lyase family enzyme
MEFRNARHTNDLKPIIEFYTKILGLEVLFSFENHNDYSGVFLGLPGLDWHLEFTTSETKAVHVFDAEDLLVFYPKERSVYDGIVENIRNHNIEEFKARNPFWDDNGVMIKDPDGYGVIISDFKLK